MSAAGRQRAPPKGSTSRCVLLRIPPMLIAGIRKINRGGKSGKQMVLEKKKPRTAATGLGSFTTDRKGSE